MNNYITKELKDYCLVIRNPLNVQEKSVKLELLD